MSDASMPRERAFGSGYLLGEEIGRGAMGRVYRATVRATGEAVAIKLLHDHIADQSEAVARFLQERRLLSSIDDPHVVKVRDLVAENGQLGIVMDLIDGGDLTHAAPSPCPADVAVEIVRQIAQGLAAVHQAGIVHRDLKPSNVLCTMQGDQRRVLITDFGISRLLGDTMTTSTHAIGTPGYLAPEVAREERATPATDLYSLGVLLYELCTGRRPFVADSVYAVLRAHIESPVPRPIEMPDDLWQIITSLLAKQPTDRPSAQRVALALAHIGPGLSGQGPFRLPAAGSPASPAHVPETGEAITVARLATTQADHDDRSKQGAPSGVTAAAAAFAVTIAAGSFVFWRTTTRQDITTAPIATNSTVAISPTSLSTTATPSPSSSPVAPRSAASPAPTMSAAPPSQRPVTSTQATARRTTKTVKVVVTPTPVATAPRTCAEKVTPAMPFAQGATFRVHYTQCSDTSVVAWQFDVVGGQDPISMIPHLGRTGMDPSWHASTTDAQGGIKYECPCTIAASTEKVWTFSRTFENHIHAWAYVTWRPAGSTGTWAKSALVTLR